jgi:hypothetical protein
MYIVLIAWIFIIGTLALGAESTLAGAALFLGGGLLPVWLVVWVAARRARIARRASAEAAAALRGPDDAP